MLRLLKSLGGHCRRTSLSCFHLAMELSRYPVLSFLDDSLLTVSLLSPLFELGLNLTEPLHLVVSLRELLDCVLILLFKEGLKVLARELSVLKLIDLDLGEVNYLR